MATAAFERKPTVKQRVGHLRVDEQGEISYKKTPSSTLMASLQLGLSHSIGSIEPKPRRDLLTTDFDVIETVEFPNSGSDFTPAHKYKDFTFTTYSPLAFRFFREAFQIKAEDYLLALCNHPMRELSNPGASGSLFYLSADDEFIIKTVQKKETKFLQKLLPAYYLNLTQNKKTLLPKFFGLYQYRCGATKIRIVVMNNLLPSSIQYHYKFDLKGSSYKRKASSAEKEKKSPTYKDLDYRHHFPEGIFLSPERYDILSRTLERDCRVLQSFEIMDYSLLLGIHRIDETAKVDLPPGSPLDITTESNLISPTSDDETRDKKPPLLSKIEARKNFSIMADELLDPDVDPGDASRLNYPEGYIMARTEQGDKLLLYVGVIDILQSYILKKRLEHGLKSFITDGDTVSVHNPSFYSERFQTFLNSEVFKKEKVRIRPRKNSTPYRGANRKASINRMPNKERVSRDSDVVRPLSQTQIDTSPAHLPQNSDSLRRRNKENTPPIAEEDIRVVLMVDEENKDINLPPLNRTPVLITKHDDDRNPDLVQTTVIFNVPDSGGSGTNATVVDDGMVTSQSNTVVTVPLSTD